MKERSRNRLEASASGGSSGGGGETRCSGSSGQVGAELGIVFWSWTPL